MNFGSVFQSKDKKFWWMDVVLYLAVSLLLAAVFCYIVFLIKNSIQRKQINDEILALQTVGTDQQKEQEKEVISYQKKIKDFSSLFENHEFASNVFSFMERETIPNIWFRQFDLDERNRQVQLSGESDDMEAFSRQMASLEKNEYVKSVGSLNSALGEGAKVEFNFSLQLDPKIFSYALRPQQPQENALLQSLPETEANETPEKGVALKEDQTQQTVAKPSVLPEAPKSNETENQPETDRVLIVVIIVAGVIAVALSLALLIFKKMKNKKQAQQNNFYSNAN